MVFVNGKLSSADFFKILNQDFTRPLDEIVAFRIKTFSQIIGDVRFYAVAQNGELFGAAVILPDFEKLCRLGVEFGKGFADFRLVAAKLKEVVRLFKLFEGRKSLPACFRRYFTVIGVEFFRLQPRFGDLLGLRFHLLAFLRGENLVEV